MQSTIASENVEVDWNDLLVYNTNQAVLHLIDGSSAVELQISSSTTPDSTVYSVC